MHGGKERVVLLLAPRLQKAVDLLRRARTLEQLTVQLAFLNFLHAQPLGHGHPGALEVSATTARGNQIRHAGRLLGERPRVHRLTKEFLSKVNHLQQTHAHDGGLGVVTPAATVDEAGSQRNNVLQGAAQRDTGDVGDHADVEVGAVEEVLEDLVVQGRVLGGYGGELRLGGAAAGVLVLHVNGCQGREAVAAVDVGVRGGGTRSRGARVIHGRGVVGDGGLGPLLGGDFGGNVGAGEGTAVDAEAVTDPFREKGDAVVGDVDALDAGDAASKGQDVTVELLADIADKLVGKIEDEDGGILDGVLQGGVRDDVVGELDTGQVFCVLVVFVDDGGQLLGLLAEGGIVVRGCRVESDILLVHPHVHIFFEQVGEGLCVFGNDLGNG